MANIKILNFERDSMRLGAVIKFLSVLILFAFFFISFLQIHVYNYDFWWHLATGKYIVENGDLPQSDPFSYTTDATPSDRKSIILKGNWLAEVIFYKIYSLWDLKGIIILRSLLLVLFLFFVFMSIKKQNASDLVALILIAGVFILAISFPGERPQLFTFLIFSIVFYLFEDFRVNRSKKIFLVPVLVLVLSNMHPGYIVCIFLVTLYLSGEGVLYVLRKDFSNERFRTLFIVWILTIIFALLNPNGLSAFKEIFFMGKHTAGIVEFMPTFYIYTNKFKPLDYSYMIFLLFSLLSVRYFRKIGLVHMLMLIVFTIMSFVAIRYVIFYMCIAAPILAKIIINLREERIFERLFRILKPREGFLYLIACIIGIFLIFNSIPALARYEFRADTSFAVPKGAADFLAKLEISGNMFNEYGFGGYLIWRLYPDKKVFIDGRSLEPDVYDEYRIMAFASVGQNQSREDIIKKYTISFIVMPPLMPRGLVYPLVEELFEREDWTLIYNDQLSLIFLRNNSENRHIINRFAIDKKEGLNTIIIQASGRAMKNRTNPYYTITLGKLFYKMGRFDDAEKAFSMAYQRDPKNQMITEWLQKVRENKSKQR